MFRGMVALTLLCGVAGVQASDSGEVRRNASDQGGRGTLVSIHIGKEGVPSCFVCEEEELETSVEVFLTKKLSEFRSSLCDGERPFSERFFGDAFQSVSIH